MDFLTNALGGLNIEAIIQLTLVAMIMISGPIVIFILAASRGDL